MRTGELGTALFLSLAAMGCRSAPKGPEPTLPLAPVTKADILGEFSATLALTRSVDQHAMRRPPLAAVVDAQTRAMVEHVQKHGRGEFDPSAFLGDRAKSDLEPLARLDNVAIRLFAFLGLDSGPRELGQVALAALAKELGDDAAFRDVETDDAIDTADVVPEMRDGIGILQVPRLSDKTVEHALVILAQWAANQPPIRAVVLDLSRCRGGSPVGATEIVSVFAPGEVVFSSDARASNAERVDRRGWRGKAGWSAPAYQKASLFVVTSARTDPIAEVVAHALRHHRTARILGGMTQGTGRVMAWYDVPWKTSFGFTIAELMDPEERPLRGRPVIPDACLRDATFVRLAERTPSAYRERCGNAGGDAPKEVVLEYVRNLLASEQPVTPAEPGRAPPPSKGRK
jgi:hypothetical protein